MYFQISPVRKVKKKCIPIPVVEEKSVLTLAPFTAVPKLSFENIRVGTTSTKILYIKNPNNVTYKVTLSKIPPPERGVTLSWTTSEVNPEEEIYLEVTWTPRENGGWRDILSVLDDRSVRRDVPIVFKTTSPAKGKKKASAVLCPKRIQKPVTVKLVKTTAKRMSTKKPKRKSPIPKLMVNDQPLPAHQRFTFSLDSDKENSPILNTSKLSFTQKLNQLNSFTFLSPSNVNFEENVSPTPVRRQTYAIKKQTVLRQISPQLSDNSVFSDSLELTEKNEVTPLKANAHYTVNNLLRFLESDSFVLSPAKQNVTPKLAQSLFLAEFRPFDCSTGEKAGPEHTARGPDRSTSSKELFQEARSNDTYEITDAIGNISSETYTKRNASSDTYTKDDLSNSSLSCVPSPEPPRRSLRVSAGAFLRNTSSPLGPAPLPEYSGSAWARPLSCITEERSSVMAQQDSSSEGAWPRDKLLSKRKAGQKADVFQVSPPKRMHRSVRRPPASLHLAAAPPRPAPPRSDPFVVMATNSNPFCMSLVDPFMCSSMYYDERWLDRQMAELKKWLNALLTPPSELSANLQAVQVDVVRLWNECRRKELAYAPTREKVSSMYHTRGRLDGLRRAARALFLSAPMNLVLSKVTIAVEKRKLSIRQDRDLHLDVGLQAHVMGLLLCYNPLWLRVGLEALYQQQIPLEGNSDVIGLSTFIMLRLFRDPYLQSKNKHPTVHNLYLPAYAGAIKKFTLKKFLMLVYFLDQAKAQRLIAHDPCLFCRNAPVKESREILFSFSRELLTAVGDITKYLKCLGYVVRHKQTYIDEFDYAVRDLGTDLRDGVRLARTMEIIGARDDLTRRMRVPAISRLQKIHNVKVVFESLDQAGFHIVGDIDPKDIVDGHREKTLSLLWQIIYKFQMPRFHRAAATIQAWWHSLAVTVRKKALAKQRARRAAAAARIQAWYRSLQAMWLERAAFTHKRQAATTIQRFVHIKLMMLRHRRQFLHKRQAAICIQRRFRARNLTRVVRRNYQMMRTATLTIQRRFRSFFAMKQLRHVYLQQKHSAIVIQRWFRSRLVVRVHREGFMRTRNAVKTIQQHFRALRAMRVEMAKYSRCKLAALTIQRHFRSMLLMRQERQRYLSMKRSATIIQQRYRALISMKRVRQEFLAQRQVVVLLQQRFRANQTMKQHQKEYTQLKTTTVTIQRLFRAKLAMKHHREQYLEQRKSAVLIQCWFRATTIMKHTRRQYLQLRKSVMFVQQYFRANQVMKHHREQYLMQRKSAMLIQCWFRTTTTMKYTRKQYLQLKKSVVVVQQYFRANQAMKIEQYSYLKLRKSAMVVQRRFRANQAMKIERDNYLKLRKSAMVLQQYFRANQAMKIERENYLKLRKSAIVVQHYFRANQAMKIRRDNYLILRKSVVIVQKYFRANQAMKIERENYLKLRKSAIVVQQYFRANQAMKIKRDSYLKLRKSVVIVQQYFRANQTMKIERNNYLKLRKSVVVVQQYFRANLAMKMERNNYLKFKKSAVVVQRRFRANQVSKIERDNYLKLRKSAVILQRRYRARRMMIDYIKQRNSAVALQRWFRSLQAMKLERSNYLKTLNAITTIQNYLRSVLTMKKVKTQYTLLKNAAVVIQRRYRARLLMKEAVHKYLALQKACITCQQHYRAKLTARQVRQRYTAMRDAATLIQQRWRATLAMKQDQKNYYALKKSSVMIQHWYRHTKIMRSTRDQYLELRAAIMVVQQRFRANRATRKFRLQYLELKTSVTFIQCRFRELQTTRKIRRDFLALKQATLIFQQRFRAQIAMRNARRQYLVKRNAIILIQQKLRSRIAMVAQRTSYVTTRNAAIMIQQWYRSVVTTRRIKQEYLLIRKSVITIQQRFRALQTMKTVRNHYLEKKQSCRVIQDWYKAILKMRSDRENYLNIRTATVLIQRWYRSIQSMKVTRKQYLDLKSTVVLMQRRFKATQSMKQHRKEYLQLRNACVLIQRWYRAEIQMRNYWKRYEAQKKSAVIIQRYYRSYLLKKTARTNFVRVRKAVIKIQRWYRAVTLKRTILKNLEEYKEFRRINKAATKIQSAWRGYKVRKQENTTVTLIRQRTIEANNRALPDQTLGQRSVEAIEKLVGQTSMKEIIRSLTCLDFITRLCPNICVKVCDKLTEQLYIFLSCANRSVPDMDACILSISILINLKKFPSTSKYVWKSEYVDTLLSLLMHWSDKDGLLFPYLCTLVWLLTQTPEHCKIILQETNAVKRLQKTYIQCERKQKMLKNVRNMGPSKVNFQKPGKVVYPLPALTPDWGIINDQHPRTFQSPLHGIRSIFKKLGIKVN